MADILGDNSLLIIFTASPHGLGHLRVTDALYHGLPDTADPVLIGAQDKLGRHIYRQISINPLTRGIMERVQDGRMGENAARLGRFLIRSQAKHTYNELVSIFNERVNIPRTALLIATHSIQAHQIAVVKDKLEKETGIQLVFVVQVTDDSPQPIWYVPEADVIVVPSNYTKDALISYAKKSGLPQVPIWVVAYPVSPRLTENLSETAFEKRKEQLRAHGKAQIHMSIPISGAGIGTTFFAGLLPQLHHESDRFFFHVVVKDAPFTKKFIYDIGKLPYAKLYTAQHDRETVDQYESMFTDSPVSIEITKPSEQSFKALLPPKEKGGVILLFTEPVGRQEYDNLNFMRSHRLMPHLHETDMLFRLATRNLPVTPDLLLLTHTWRALPLPKIEQAHFITWCLTEGIFARMATYTKREQSNEMSSHGVKQFWELMAEVLRERS